MNWKELIGNNFSRKLGIAAITIIALCYLGKNGEINNSYIPLIALYVTIVGICGVVVQGFLDFLRPRKRRPKEPNAIDQTVDNTIDQTVEPSIERNQT